MNKIVIQIFIFAFSINFLIPVKALAQDYVLPYPSYMPGHFLYPFHEYWQKVQAYWYFGDMAKVKYHLGASDKYLVEAKTLFEYDQYKLALVSLEKSNIHFAKAVLYERDVVHKRKDKGEQKNILKYAGETHQNVIKQLTDKLPEKIEWRPEKTNPETLQIHFLLKEADVIRSYASR